MGLILGTKLKMDGKVVEEGTPVSKLTKAQKDIAKELNLLQEEPEADEDDEAEDEEDSSEDSEADEGTTKES